MKLLKNKFFYLVALIILGQFILPHMLGGLDKDYSHSTFFKDRAGRVLYLSTSKDQKYRSWSFFEKIPNELKETFLNKEDQYFYYHFGVNPFSLIRAAFITYFTSQGRYGGSTLTMQLARLHYDINTKSILGKLHQIALSLWLEYRYSKKQIFEAYLNLAPFGRNIEGVKAASYIYFRKELEDLSHLERILLSHIPQAPSYLNSHKKKSKVPKVFQEELKRYIDKFAGEINLKTISELELNSINSLPFKAKHLVMRFLNEADEKKEINFTIDLEIQSLLLKAANSYLLEQRKKGVSNLSALLVDTKSMEVLGYIGSANFYDKDILGQNDGIVAKRSPGSTLKPFIYALALEQGLIHPKSILYDVPLHYRTPENYDKKFLGPIDATQALVKSRNVPAVYLNNLLKVPSLFDTLKSAKIIPYEQENIYGSSLALGGLEVSMEQLTSLYSAIANFGVYKNLQYKKQNQNNNSIAVSILTKEASILIREMLSENQRPGFENSFSFTDEMKIAWKTGTSIGFRDAWSVGLIGQYALAVWVGNFNGKASPNFIGRKTAAPLFFAFADRIKPYAEEKLLHSSKLTEVEVCSRSGKIPHDHCPHLVKTSFWPGVSPIKKCDVHQKISVSKKSGMRTCDEKVEKIERVYEVWPTDVHAIYKQLNFALKAPPAFDQTCQRFQKNKMFDHLKINSPKIGMKYQTEKLRRAKIYFNARASTETQQLFWYVNGKFIGSAKPDEHLFYDLKPGNYSAQVVDDLGNMTMRSFVVQ